MRLTEGGERLAVMGAFVAIAAGVSCGGSADSRPTATPAVSTPTGMLAAASGTSVVVVPAAGSSSVVTLEAGAEFGDVSWSPDGRAIAYATRDGLAVIDVGTRVIRRLETRPGVSLEPLFNGDGSRIYFLHSRSRSGTTYDLWSIDLEGKAVQHTHGADISMVAVSPDERRIAFVRDFEPSGLGKVYVSDRSGSQTRLLAPGIQLTFSPDGGAVAYATERGVEVVAADGGPSRLVAKDGDRPTFSPDGRWIAFLRDASCADHAYCRRTVSLVPVAGGTAKAIGPELDEPGRISWIAEGSEEDKTLPPAVVDAYCSSSGDLCYGIRIERGSLVLAIDTYARYFDRYRLCVRAPKGDRACRSFPIRKQVRLYGSSVAWSESFVDRGPGTYVATWRLGPGSLGPPLRFRLG